MTQSFRNLFCFSLILLISLEVSQIFGQSLRFNNLTVEDGLSNNDVNTVIQDKTGFIWFGTEDGLNRYDGHNFKVFRHDPSDSSSISDNSIWAIMEDSKGSIWVGTKDGILNQYDPELESFYRWHLVKEGTKEASITAIFEDNKGNMWVGTRGRGLYTFNPGDSTRTNFTRSSIVPNSLSHPSVRSILQDIDGNIIVGTYYGLNKLNPDSLQLGFKKFFYSNEDPNTLSHDQIYNLTKSKLNPEIIWIGTPDGITEYNSVQDSFRRIEIPNPKNIQFGSGGSTVIEKFVNHNKILWIDTYGGLVRLNLGSGESIRFNHIENTEHSIIDNQINKILKDRSGVLWLATESGISCLSAKSLRFNSPFDDETAFYLKATEDKKDLNSIYQNKNGDIWFGFSNGIIRLKNVNGTLEKENPKMLDGLNTWSLGEDYKKSLWIGTFGQGLLEYNLNIGSLKKWILRFPVKNTTTVPFVKSIYLDDENYLWVGFWGSGLGRINLSTEAYDLWLSHLTNPDALSQQDVWTILQDNLGRTWIGTFGGGLNLFEETDNGKFHHWMQGDSKTDGLVSNNISAIHEWSRTKNLRSENITVLWLGTSGGLNKFIIRNDELSLYNFDVEVISYTVDDGLPDNSVNSILEDKNGDLWLGTGSGISYFNVEREIFTNFSSEDGLNGKVMNPSSALLLDSGLMLFGSKKGLNVFDPEKIKLSHFVPPLVITDFKIFNESVNIEADSTLTKSISNIEEIHLTYDQDVFSFEFAALDYNSPQSIEYAYKMEGFDADWIESGNRRFVTYTNLDPGKYVFKVKSTNADGTWNDRETLLSIIINPPWWRTIWAYISYVILIFLGLLGIRKFELSRTKLRNELKLREIEVRNKSELEEVKSRFFANLSHEFRTPLMLIKGPLEQLKSGVSNKDSVDNIELIERNSARLKELIDQLLELSQLEKAAVPLKAEHINLVETLRGLLASFEALAKQKNIELKFESDLSSETCWIDRDKFEKIINNLLSNAFKFTSQGGIVSVTLKDFSTDGKQFAEIIISDSGVGISKSKIDKVFDRFFQVDDSAQRSYGGSGIGLALVKEFVDLHKWKISVDSEEGKGTEFKIQIPMWEDYLNEDEKVYDASAETVSYSDINKSEPELSIHKTNIKQKAQLTENLKNKPLLLIVDDSEDVRKYLYSLLKNDYQISMAENGEKGIKVASEINPDLIVSDVMMPSMDGIEFCNKIKSNWMTSDIPVILLTAKASVESKLEGLEMGADDYLTKPFDSRELFTRIKNLLDQRKRLRDKYNKELDSPIETGKLNSSDTEFINRVLDLLDKNIDKTNFGTEKLAKELFVSRTKLHRKLHSITGQAPGEFVRIFKLKRAAQLLLEGKFSVTQVAYEIGFSSPAQFTRAFSKQFDCLPSEFPSYQKSFN